MRKFKKILKAVFAVMLIGVVIFGAVSIFGKDTKTISSLAFSVGAIDENGNHVENEQALYTKNMFECKGLEVELDYETNSKYRIFYYNIDKNFLSSTETLDTSFIGAEIPVAAKYARIMIIPALPEGETRSEFSINYFEKFGYANDIKITVDKDQEMENLVIEADTDTAYKIDESTGKLVTIEFDGMCTSEAIVLSQYGSVMVKNPGNEVFEILIEKSDGSVEVMRVAPQKSDIVEATDYSGGKIYFTYSIEAEMPIVYPYG